MCYLGLLLIKTLGSYLRRVTGLATVCHCWIVMRNMKYACGGLLALTLKPQNNELSRKSLPFHNVLHEGPLVNYCDFIQTVGNTTSLNMAQQNSFIRDLVFVAKEHLFQFSYLSHPAFRYLSKYSCIKTNVIY